MTPEQKVKLYEEWKERKATASECAGATVNTEDPPDVPPPPEVTAAEAVRRQRNRERYPEIAEFLDDCRRYFGAGVEIISLEEKP